MSQLFNKSMAQSLDYFFQEDDLARNSFYLNSLPKDMVKGRILVKSDCVLSGLPFFFSALNYLSDEKIEVQNYDSIEGRLIQASKICPVLEFDLPFNIALTGERIALNLLQHSSAISTYTNKYVELAKASNTKILDTRKTLPGLRGVEKYATRLGGASNHRFGQADVWMVKDNHKSFFGGLKHALDYFKNMNSFYNPIVVEIHDLEELKEGIELGVNHFMLDNFSIDDIHAAIKIKRAGTTYEASGGIRLETIENYLIDGIDAISVGALTYAAPPVDISFKYEKV